MTLVYQASGSDPQTHALIVGVGGYPHLSGGTGRPARENFGLGQLHDSPLSAALICDWLLTRFNNPSAPLGSIELLGSQVGTPFIYRPPSGTSDLTIEEPNMPAFKTAARAWFERVGRHAGNMALFYFCGQGFEQGADTFLLLADFGSDEVGLLDSVVEFPHLLSALRTCPAARQIFFVDTCRHSLPTFPTRGAPSIIGISAAASTPTSHLVRQSIYFAAAQGELAWAPADEPSLFTKALIASLDERERTRPGEPINTAELASELDRHLTTIASAAGVKQTVEARVEPFDFHHPRGGATGDTPPSPDAVGAKTADATPTPSPDTPAQKPADAAARAAPRQTPPPEPPESNTQFVPDDAEIDRDELGRGVLALALARRLHRIWCALNGAASPDPAESPQPPVVQRAPGVDAALAHRAAATESCFFDRGRDNTRAAFVMHLDAPWGGGKTTFANFLARVLNPNGFQHGPGSFLRQRYGNANISTIFLEDPPPADGSSARAAAEWPTDACRPWIIVPFNAWQMEHCTPPWWVFYQTIRQRCFASVLCEGHAAADPKAKTLPAKPEWKDRLHAWLELWGHEYLWRLKNPKVRTLLTTALVSLLLLLALYALGIVSLSGGATEQKFGFNLSNTIGVMLAGITTLGTFWAFGALVMESLVPGTDTLAERLSLGNGDPFERFRRHFYATMERIMRPVLVVVDDLDRCKPEFIVDLVRGMQTLLRSPRVVFVILGDRDWIERAFETHHKAMSKMRVGPEQTFGARFVEKAIQMSFILPGLPAPRQADFVRWILLGRRAKHSGAAPAAIKPQTAAKLREVINKTADTQKGTSLENEEIRKEVLSAYNNLAPEMKLADQRPPSEQIDQFVNDELAIRAAVDQAVEKEISHRLEPLAAFFPPNPRQIKRIINSVTMYHAVALQQTGLSAEDPRWFQLALWIVIMTEWPETWRLLASFPEVATLVNAEKPDEQIENSILTDLPGSKEATLKAVSRIRADEALMALITGRGRAGPVLDRAAIETLLTLTPLHSRRSRLMEEPDAKNNDKDQDEDA